GSPLSRKSPAAAPKAASERALSFTALSGHPQLCGGVAEHHVVLGVAPSDPAIEKPLFGFLSPRQPAAPLPVVHTREQRVAGVVPVAHDLHRQSGGLQREQLVYGFDERRDTRVPALEDGGRWRVHILDAVEESGIEVADVRNRAA